MTTCFPIMFIVLLQTIDKKAKIFPQLIWNFLNVGINILNVGINILYRQNFISIYDPPIKIAAIKIIIAANMWLIEYRWIDLKRGLLNERGYRFTEVSRYTVAFSLYIGPNCKTHNTNPWNKVSHLVLLTR